MKAPQAVCNYALLQFLPYPETGEFVNVGVLAACGDPCLLQFAAAATMPERVRAMFPRQNAQAYADAMAAMKTEMERVATSVGDAKTCQRLFAEVVRRRESKFRFGDVRTMLTHAPERMGDELFRRYVLGEEVQPSTPALARA